MGSRFVDAHPASRDCAPLHRLHETTGNALGLTLCFFFLPFPPMDRPTMLAAAAVIFSLLAVLVAFFVAFQPNLPNRTERANELYAAQQADETALLTNMIYFQRYLEKASAAANAENWPLATFYAERITQNAAWVVDAGYQLDGTELSALASEVAVPAAQALVEATDSRSATRFQDALLTMTNACNTCHARSGHPFIRIVPPAEVEWPSQRFAPVGSSREGMR